LEPGTACRVYGFIFVADAAINQKKNARRAAGGVSIPPPADKLC
jgi:hypothetical protein